jgi:ABC-type glycerol-3-phosphate transport system substrate-binding protein
MDWLKERASMFFCHPIPPAAIISQNPKMQEEHYYRVAQYPGFESGKGFSSTYGFNLVVNANAPQDKREVLQDMYKFVMSDAGDAWKDTQPFTLARKSGFSDNPVVKQFPQVDAIIKARDDGVFLPRTLVYNELADAMHRAIQEIVLNRADIQTKLNEVATEVDRATAAYKKG